MATQSSSSLFLRISPDFTAAPRSSFSSPPTSPTGVSFRRYTRSFSGSYASAETARSPPYLDSKTSSSSFATLYEVLGIPMGASCHEIKAAYRKLARVVHPDVVAIQGNKDNSSDEFIKIHAAYSTLSDPEKRSDYDRKLFKRQRSQSSGYAKYASPSVQSTGFSGHTRRNWETDQCW